MPNIGAPELIIVLLIALLIFGGAKLPKLARSLREAKDEFEGGKSEPKKSAPKELPGSDADDKVTLSKSELDALLTERELKAKRD
jgi:sec-independent protein translocase protein TatA